VPVIWNPALGPDNGSTSGLGDIQLSAFLSPANPGHWIWGVGAIGQFPTNSNEELGNRNWGLGPTFVVLHLDHDSPWVYGVLGVHPRDAGPRDHVVIAGNGYFVIFVTAPSR